MKTELLQIGKTDQAYLVEGIDKYTKRIKHYIGFTIVTIPGIKSQAKTPVNSIKEKEAEKLLKKIHQNDFVTLLDENGKTLDSAGFASFIEKKTVTGVKKMVFVIGGAYGFHEKILKRANYTLALSKLTFPHQLVRLIFLEQLYRALTIIKGEAYHHK